VPVKSPSSLIPPLRHTLLFSLASGLFFASGVSPVTSLISAASAAGNELGFADRSVCLAPIIELPAVLKAAPKGNAAEQNIGIEGDQLELQGKDRVMMQGNAQIVQGRRGVFADKIVYDQQSYFAELDGNVVYYSEAGDELKAESMRMEIDTFIGEAGNAQIRMADRQKIRKTSKVNYLEDYSILAPFKHIPDELPEIENADAPRVGNRVWAEKVEIEGEDFQRVHRAKITRCPNSEDVMISGDEIELDQGEGVGYAKNVVVRFKGVPILWAPRLSFPLNDERKTGFLAPSIGNDKQSGFMVSTPYYIDIAPNYDATIRPTYYSDRGGQVYGEFRHMNKKGNGVIKAEYMPQDKLFADQDRYAYGLDYQQRYDNGWNWTIDLQDVSDTSYLNDFRNDINITSATHLQQRAQLNFSNSLLYARGTASKYTVSAPDLASTNPYERLPQLEFGIRPQSMGAFELGFDSELVSFADDNEGARVTGTRVNLLPYIEMPVTPIFGYVKPKLSFQAISYQLDNLQPGEEESPSALVPRLSVDSGLVFERDMTLGGMGMLQTLEPRLMYVYVPEVDQNDMPLFDTGEGSISSYNVLFRERRFFGGDRVGDDNHVSLGITTRILADSDGRERLKASLGQLYYLSDRVVGLNANDESGTSGASDIFAELNALMTNEIDFRSTFRWQKDGTLQNLSAGVQYSSGLRRGVTADYFKDSFSNEDIRFTMDWPLASRWQFVTGQRYSITDSDFRESSVGLVYDSCCWAVGMSASRNLQSDGEYNDRFVLSLELAGLGKISTAQ